MTVEIIILNKMLLFMLMHGGDCKEKCKVKLRAFILPLKNRISFLSFFFDNLLQKSCKFFLYLFEIYVSHFKSITRLCRFYIPKMSFSKDLGTISSECKHPKIALYLPVSVKGLDPKFKWCLASRCETTFCHKDRIFFFCMKLIT